MQLSVLSAVPTTFFPSLCSCCVYVCVHMRECTHFPKSPSINLSILSKPPAQCSDFPGRRTCSLSDWHRAHLQTIKYPSWCLETYELCSQTWVPFHNRLLCESGKWPSACAFLLHETHTYLGEVVFTLNRTGNCDSGIPAHWPRLPNSDTLSPLSSLSFPSEESDFKGWLGEHKGEEVNILVALCLGVVSLFFFKITFIFKDTFIFILCVYVFSQHKCMCAMCI